MMLWASWKDSIDLPRRTRVMPPDDALLDMLVDAHKESPLDFVLLLDKAEYRLDNVSIARTPTPVHRPTTRGGVYFSEKFAHRITGTVSDLSTVPTLSKMMLGPSTEFGDMQVRTELDVRGDRVGLVLHANLTGSVQDPSGIQLHMMLVRIGRA